MKLKPCAHCGNNPKIRYGSAKTVEPYHSIICDGCGISMAVHLEHPDSKDSQTEYELLIKRWNTRAQEEK